jgi:predicted lipid-binding transport protein (Tim44 family)
MLATGPQIQALSDGAATGLIIAVGAGGSFALVLVLTLVTVRRSERKATRARQNQMATVGGGNGQDAYPPQPYSPNEPRSHRPYSRQFRIPRQDNGHGSTNGSRPAGSTEKEIPMAPWPPKEDD